MPAVLGTALSLLVKPLINNEADGRASSHRTEEPCYVYHLYCGQQRGPGNFTSILQASDAT